MSRDGLTRRLAACTIALLALGLLSAHAAQPPSPQVVGAATNGAAVTVVLPTTTSTTTPPTTATAPPTTAPPTTAPPATAAPTTAPPSPPTTHAHHHHHAPPPPPPPAPTTSAPPSESLQQRVERAYATGVPARWRNAIAVELSVIEGNTSWAQGGGKIMIARSHAQGRFEHLVDVVAHEFGHQVAFEYGTREYAGAAPKGWPAPPNNPAEAWADCVQSVFTGRSNPSHGLPPCGGEQLSWAANWLQSVPSRSA